MAITITSIIIVTGKSYSGREGGIMEVISLLQQLQRLGEETIDYLLTCSFTSVGSSRSQVVIG